MRIAAVGLVVSLVCVVVGIFFWRGTSSSARRDQYLSLLHGDAPPVVIDGETESRIVAFCSDCHAMPRPESFARDAWHREVLWGYHFFSKSGRSDLDPPPVHLTVAYFRARAPEQLVFPEPEEAKTELGATFDVEKLTLGGNAAALPAVSHVCWARLEPDEDPVLLACDARQGIVVAVDLRDRRRDLQVLARFVNPCRVEPCDLDGDGVTDLVVADLAAFFPADHDRGRVIWLRRQDATRDFQETVIASGLGRVADVRPADVDSDGDLDLIVAEFGMHATGSIVLLRNVARPGARPRFELEEIARPPGTIHVCVHDFNGDGLPDFAALSSQEDEQIELFVNRGEGRFHRRILWAAPDLTFGSSGIGLVDLDQDGDVDILYTNGDAFDNGYVKPSHGVQWLENLGDLQFAYHRLTDMLGAYRALAGDIDLDGDLDIVVTAMLPPQFNPPEAAALPRASILCLEQTEPGVFVRHTLETGSPYYPALELADFDSDGDLDFAVGSHVVAHYVKSTGIVSYWLAVWWNQRISPDK